jgi:hypothetical protein
VFHMDVAKVNQDVTYVVMVVHICFESLVEMFHLFFKRTPSVPKRMQF